MNRASRTRWRVLAPTELDVHCRRAKKVSRGSRVGAFRRSPDEACKGAPYRRRARAFRTPCLRLRVRELRRRGDAIYSWESRTSWQRRNRALFAASAVFTFLTLQNIRKRYPPPFSWFERITLERADGWFYCGLPSIARSTTSRLIRTTESGSVRSAWIPSWFFSRSRGTPPRA